MATGPKDIHFHRLYGNDFATGETIELDDDPECLSASVSYCFQAWEAVFIIQRKHMLPPIRVLLIPTSPFLGFCTRYNRAELFMQDMPMAW